MATNYPGPVIVEFSILNQTIVRSIQLNTTPGTTLISGMPIGDITFNRLGGGTRLAQTCINDAWGFIRALYKTDVTCLSATIWSVTPGSYQKNFVQETVPTSPTGSNTGTTNLAHQRTLSFRSGAGGIMKLTLLETTSNFLTRLPLVANPVGSEQQRIAAYMLSGDGVWIARDGGFPVAAIRDTGGQNEKAFRQRYRPT